jgi:regulator of sirC expression with transglutaminase-like and TPR domain
MTRQDVERDLADAGQAGDECFPLLGAAVACALHEEPTRAGDAVLVLAEQIGARLKHRLESESPEEALAETMAGDFRFNGELLTWNDPNNADVIAVAERRRGISWALGIFYLDAARRCGLPVDGVDFPGHFLLRIESNEGPLALDPFSEGRVVLPSELSRRALRAGLTPDVADRLDLLMAPVKDRAVLIRLQNYSFARAQQARDYPRAERAAIRRALLDPTDHRPWIDVAAAREGQGALAGALEALNRAQQLDGGAAIAARAARERLRMRLN